MTTFAKTFKRGDRVEHVEESLCRGIFLRLHGDGFSAEVDFGGDGGVDVLPLSDLRHAPVTVVGPLPPKAPSACPDCGGAIFVDFSAEMFDPTEARPKLRKVRAAFCSACEWAKEF